MSIEWIVAKVGKVQGYEQKNVDPDDRWCGQISGNYAKNSYFSLSCAPCNLCEKFRKGQRWCLKDFENDVCIHIFKDEYYFLNIVLSAIIKYTIGNS